MSGFDAWYRQLPGLMVLTSEKTWLDRILSHERGRILLQIGGAQDERLTERARVTKVIFLDTVCATENTKPKIQARSDLLPIDADSIDVVLLLHALEFADNAAPVLQEAQRVVKPGGKIIVIGLNRFGVWNLARYFLQKNILLPVKQYISPGKVGRFLRALDCEVVTQHTFCFQFPTTNPAAAKCCAWLETAGQFLLPHHGGVFMTTAIKRVVGMMPLLEENWRERLRVSAGAPEPTMRNY